MVHCNGKKGALSSITHTSLTLVIVFLVLFLIAPIVGAMATTPTMSAPPSFHATQETAAFHQFAASAVDLSNVGYDSLTNCLLVERSVRNWDLETRQTYLYQILLPRDDRQSATCLPPTPMDPSITCRCTSPSGKRMIVTKKKTDRNGSDGISLEIWEDGTLQRKLSDFPHGPILNQDVTFGSPAWAPDESFVVYPAERVIPKTKHFWGAEKDDKIELGTKHVMGQGIEEDWGERYPDQAALIDLYVLNVHTGKIGKLSNVPGSDESSSDNTLGSATLGQPVINPLRPTEVAYTAFDAGGLGQMTRRLGMIFCRNRPSQICVSKIENLLQDLASDDEEEHERERDAGYKCLTPDLALARSPQYVRDGSGSSLLVCLGSTNNFQTHDGCVGLYQCDEDHRNSEIVPIQTKPKTSGPTVPSESGIGFPGLFLGSLSTTACPDLAQASNCIVTTVLWGSLLRVVQINVRTKQVTLLDIPTLDPLSSQTLMRCLSPTEMIISESLSNRPTRLWKVSFGEKSAKEEASIVTASSSKLLAEFGPIACSSCAKVEQTSPAHFPFEMKLLSVSPPSIDGTTGEPIQVICLFPHKATPDSKVPLVVIPHGGPCSATTTAYVPGVAYLASHYAVILPNYRGSTGFGQGSLESLATRIGVVDVQDVMACMQHVLAEFSDIVDKSKVGICGGSHGGFLAAHLTSQYPDQFCAAVMRNPVTNIASMVTATDIPDWCYVEALGSYNFAKFQGPTKSEMETMYEKSPVKNVDRVRTPTMVALGLKDLRVPPSQGKEWYFSLRSRGIPTELLIYPEDNHSLSLVCTEADHWIRIRKWFATYFSDCAQGES